VRRLVGQGRGLAVGEQALLAEGVAHDGAERDVQPQALLARAHGEEQHVALDAGAGVGHVARLERDLAVLEARGEAADGEGAGAQQRVEVEVQRDDGVVVADHTRQLEAADHAGAEGRRFGRQEGVHLVAHRLGGAVTAHALDGHDDAAERALGALGRHRRRSERDGDHGGGQDEPDEPPARPPAPEPRQNSAVAATITFICHRSPRGVARPAASAGTSGPSSGWRSWHSYSRPAWSQSRKR